MCPFFLLSSSEADGICLGGHSFFWGGGGNDVDLKGNKLGEERYTGCIHKPFYSPLMGLRHLVIVVEVAYLVFVY